MLRLYFSLASPFLFLALCENENCLISFQKENHRLHSDNFLSHLKEILNSVNRSLSQLNEIYFTSSPSGQTGLRISLAFLATLQVLNPKIKFYHLNTLLFQAGNDNCISLLTIDRRASKYHVAVYQQKHCLLITQIIQKKELTALMKQFGSFVIRQDFNGVDFLSHFQALRAEFTRLNEIAEFDL